MATGKVYLVGAGPGDPGLLTVRGRRALAEADAIVMDHLAPARLLRYARPDAEVYDVGKEAGHHKLPQREIEALLIRLARAGKTVVRLKGGDPFVFGRGGEEALALTEAGIPWQVVPGVTSAVAVPAYAGLPITHRRVSPTFTVLTGHQCAQMLAEGTARGGGRGVIDWASLARSGGTLVILMGMSKLQAIVDNLVVAGRAPETPAAAIQWGTRAAQRTVRAPLVHLPQAVRAAGLGSPAVVVIGEVAGLPDALAWFERQPMFGRRVVVVGESEEETLKRAEDVEALGAEAVDLPLAPYARPVADAARAWVAALGTWSARRPERVAWVLRTGLGVRSVWTALREAGLDARALAGVRLVASGDAAADALRRVGLVPDAVVGAAGDARRTSRMDGPAWREALAESAAWCAGLTGHETEVWVEDLPAVGGLPAGLERHPGAQAGGGSAEGSGDSTRAVIHRVRLWQPDPARLRLRLERLWADVDDAEPDVIWADTPLAAALWFDVCGTCRTRPDEVPLVVGGTADDVVAACAGAGRHASAASEETGTG